MRFKRYFLLSIFDPLIIDCKILAPSHLLLLLLLPVVRGLEVAHGVRLELLQADLAVDPLDGVVHRALDVVKRSVNCLHHVNKIFHS